MNRFVACIFARGGSKGLPDKNIKILAGKPLIAWSIEHARAVPRIGRIIVSTDSDEIAKVAMSYGAEVPFIRPAELAKDDSPEWLAWQHALEFLQKDEGSLPHALVSLPTTSPLRTPADIEECLDAFEKYLPDMVITVTEAKRSPYFNMVTVDNVGITKLVMEQKTRVSRRQDAPLVYDITTLVYVARSEFVLIKNGLFEGNVISVKIPIERGLDIDTLLDFQIAEYLMKKMD
jgi:CMP-N-acetylneuraminic acid synthetase